MTFLVLLRKELSHYFKSPLIYVITGLFSLIIGWTFFNLLANYVESLQNVPENLGGQISIVQTVLFRYFGNMNFLFLFICPLISMRLIAEEKKNHSIEFLLTAPISNFQIVISKFISSVVIILFMLLPTFIFPIVLSTSGLKEYGYLFSGYLGVFLTASSFLSLGLLASSLTENQIIAALLTSIMILFGWMISWASQSTQNLILVEIYKYTGMVDHFDNLVRGMIQTSDLVYFLSLIGFPLFLTTKVLDSRNW